MATAETSIPQSMQDRTPTTDKPSSTEAPQKLAAASQPAPSPDPAMDRPRPTEAPQKPAAGSQSAPSPAPAADRPRPTEAPQKPAVGSQQPLHKQKKAKVTSAKPMAVIGPNRSVQPKLLAPAPAAIPLESWSIAGTAVAGLSHWRKGLPCQDAVAWREEPRPILALSDGAGSAAVSELGAKALVYGVSRFLQSLEDGIAAWLDEDVKGAEAQLPIWSKRVLSHAQGILSDLAQLERRPQKDLSATLLLAVIGKVHCFWMQIGDGSIVARINGALRVLSDPSLSKGEFANQTCFVDQAGPSDVQCGLLRSQELTGLALMSDGGAEKLVATDASRVAGRLSEWFDATAHERLSPDRLAVAYYEPSMWERTSLDDRSIVLAARVEPSNNSIPKGQP